MKVSLLKMVCIAAFTGSIAAQATPLADFNGSFESRTDGKLPTLGWTLGVQKADGAEATGEVDSTSGTAKDGTNFYRITVTAVTEENWHVQLKDPTWEAKKGSVYHMSMWIRADAEHQAQISVYGGPSGKDAYRTSSGITLSTEWQEFHQVFTADTAGKGVINFALVCGFEVGVYDIDGVVIDESDPDGNIYTNGGFEAKGAGWNLWVSSDSDGGAASLSFPEEGAHSGTSFGRVTVSEAAGETYKVQLQDGSWTSEVNGIYSISLWAKADKEDTVTLAAQAGSTRDYEYIDSYNLELTTEWTQYDWVYRPPETLLLGGPDSVSIVLYLGGKAGVYDFDDISLEFIEVGIKDYPGRLTRSRHLQQFSIAVNDNSLCCSLNKNTVQPFTVSIFNVQGQRFSTHTITSGTSFSLPRPPSGTWVVRTGNINKAVIVP